MSTNLSTTEQFGIGFERSGFLGIPSSLNQTDDWSKGEFESRVSDQLPARFRRRPSEYGEPSRNGFGFRKPSEVLEAWIQAKEFDGFLFIPDAPFAFPPQHFRAFLRDGTYTVETHPTDSWPQIRIELTLSLDASLMVQKFLVRPSGDSVDSEILYTRVLYSLSTLGSGLLVSEFTADDQVIGIQFGFQPFSDEEALNILYRAKIARKLKFIEEIFNVKVKLPENITPDHVQYIESIFRGLTEGKFVSRGKGITVVVKGADISLDVPPFSGAGPFTHYLGTEQALLFPQRVLDVGPYYLKLNRAVLANPMLLAGRLGDQDLKLRFEVLDSQITYVYEKYARPERHRLVQQKLKRFYSQLVALESSQLAGTVMDPLISDVLPDAATEIAVGWLQYHSFADRFSPQEPILERDAGLWRVPIHIVYANGKGAPVGELLIDLKTGELVEEPSPEVLNQQGLAIAEKILRVG